MKTKKIRIRQGFTIVELVIVIGVVGVLAAVLIPTFISLNNKANQASDESLIKNLNTQLRIKEVTEGKNKTLTDALADALEAGYKVENLTPKAGKDIVWNQEKDEFSQPDAIPADAYKYWTVAKSMADLNKGYSPYLYFEPTEDIVVSTGIDVGTYSGINVSYVGLDSAPNRDVVIRTNGGTLTINAKDDTVRHYGRSDYVDIIAVKPDSYEERGTAYLIKVAKGNIALNAESQVGEIHLAKTNDAFDDIKVTLEGGAQLPELSRDPVGTALSSDLLVCEVVESGESEYYWLSGNATIEDQQVLVSSDKEGSDKVAATEENATAVAIANAKTGETVTDKGETVKPASEMTPEEVTEAAASGASKTFATIGSKEDLIAFRDAWNAGKLVADTFKLTANVDISGENWYPIGTWEFPFNGTFDGNGKTIKGLYANSTDAEHQGIYSNGDTVGFGETFGFFGIIGGGDVTIKNASFTDVNIDIYNGKDVAAVVGYAPSNSKFVNANASGSDHFMPVDKWTNESDVGTHAVTLSGLNVGGSILGNSSVGGVSGKIYTSGKVLIQNCRNDANITGTSNTSGIAGYIHYSSDITVDGCTNNGDVKLTGGAGIVNLNDLADKKITNNTNNGNIIYNKAYNKTSANSYSWDFIACGVHNNLAYAEYHGNTNTGKFFVQDSAEAENTKGMLIVDAGETVTITAASEFTDIVVNGTLNINANTAVYGNIWVESTGTLNVNASLSVNGTNGYIRFRNTSFTIGENGSVSAYYISVPTDFTLTNNGSLQIRVSSSSPTASTNGLKKANLTVVNNGTFIADSNMFYGENLNFTNNGTYRGNMVCTGSATIVNTENGRFEAHGGNGINFKGGSGSFTNAAEHPFGAGYDGVSIWVEGTYTVEGCNAHLGSGVTDLVLTHEGNVWTATKK